MTLHYAIRNKLLAEVRSLVESDANVNERDRYGRTPLMMCCLDNEEKWAVGVARMLLQNGAKVGLADKEGRNSLIFASIFGRVELSCLFLKAVDFNLNRKDNFGNTALHFSALKGNAKILKKILVAFSCSGTTINARNRMGQTAAGLALHLGHVLCVDSFRNGDISADFSTKVPPLLLSRPWSADLKFLKNPTLMLTESANKITSMAKIHLSRPDLNVHQFRRGSAVPADLSMTRKKRVKEKKKRKFERNQNEFALPSMLAARSSIRDTLDFQTCFLKEHFTTTPTSWRDIMPCFLDVLRVQVSDSYRASAVGVPQTYDEVFNPTTENSTSSQQTIETDENTDDKPEKTQAGGRSSRRKSVMSNDGGPGTGTEIKKKGRRNSSVADVAMLHKRKTTDKLMIPLTEAGEKTTTNGEDRKRR